VSEEDILAAIARVRAVVETAPERVQAEPAPVTVAVAVTGDLVPSAGAAAGRADAGRADPAEVAGYVAVNPATGSVASPRQDTVKASAGEIFEPA
jgi:hypothetical protein